MKGWLNIVSMTSDLHNTAMTDISKVLEQSNSSLISSAVRTASVAASDAEVVAKSLNMSITPALGAAQNPAPDARCLWCNSTFAPRMTGGSTQKFCCTTHRQQFWIAARRWTMRAIEAGLYSRSIA
jgi:hypothetical protein